MNGGYFPDDNKKEMSFRRESLSLGTTDMQISDTEQSDDGGDIRRMQSHEDVPIPTPVTPTVDDRRNVIRKAVTRRTNMLVGFISSSSSNAMLCTLNDLY